MLAAKTNSALAAIEVPDFIVPSQKLLCNLCADKASATEDEDFHRI